MLDHHTRPSRSSTFRSAPRAWLLAFGVAVVARPAVAATPEPSCNLDCEKGTTCRSYSACPGGYCQDPAGCPECPTWPVCEPAACETDEDCGIEQVCAEQTSWDCSASTATAPAETSPAGAVPASPANEADSNDADSKEAYETGGEVPDRPCEPRNVLQCTPRWQLPCVVEADCGEGFTCEEWIVCGPLPAAGAPEDKAQEPCHTSGTLSCIPREIACAGDDDCPSAFECAPNHGGCSSSSDGEMVCVSVDPPQLCVLRSSGTPPGIDDEAWGVAANGSGQLGPGRAPEESGSPEIPAPMANCSLSGARVSGGWLGLLSIAGLVAAFGGRRKRSAR
jgi:hypothetical protein